MKRWIPFEETEEGKMQEFHKMILRLSVILDETKELKRNVITKQYLLSLQKLKDPTNTEFSEMMQKEIRDDENQIAENEEILNGCGISESNLIKAMYYFRRLY